MRRPRRARAGTSTAWPRTRRRTGRRSASSGGSTRVLLLRRRPPPPRRPHRRRACPTTTTSPRRSAGGAATSCSRLSSRSTLSRHPSHPASSPPRLFGRIRSSRSLLWSPPSSRRTRRRLATMRSPTCPCVAAGCATRWAWARPRSARRSCLPIRPRPNPSQTRSSRTCSTTARPATSTRRRSSSSTTRSCSISAEARTPETLQP